MPSANPSRHVPIPEVHEGSRLRSPTDRDDVSQQWKPIGRSREQAQDTMFMLNKLARQVESMRRRILGGSGGTFEGWHFEDKIEVDNTLVYPAQTVIHIQDTHALVTTGIRDAANPTGGLVTSCAGFWVSTQSVPAKTQVSGNDVWNLPQFPYPEPADLDDPTNFWLYLGEVIAC